MRGTRLSCVNPSPMAPTELERLGSARIGRRRVRSRDLSAPTDQTLPSVLQVSGGLALPRTACPDGPPAGRTCLEVESPAIYPLWRGGVGGGRPSFAVDLRVTRGLVGEASWPLCRGGSVRFLGGRISWFGPHTVLFVLGGRGGLSRVKRGGGRGSALTLCFPLPSRPPGLAHPHPNPAGAVASLGRLAGGGNKCLQEQQRPPVAVCGSGRKRQGQRSPPPTFVLWGRGSSRCQVGLLPQSRPVKRL